MGAELCCYFVPHIIFIHKKVGSVEGIIIIVSPFSLSPHSHLRYLLPLRFDPRRYPHRPFTLTLQPPILPPKDPRKQQHHNIQPNNLEPQSPPDPDLPIPMLPRIAYLQEPLRIVCDHAVCASGYTPFHQGLVVDSPHEYRTAEGFGVTEEFGADDWGHDGFLKEVEGDVGGV